MFALVLSVFFVSCASNDGIVKAELPSVYVTNSKKVNILPADKIPFPLDEVQLFKGSFSNENSFSFSIYVQADKSGMNISVLDDFGTSLGEISYSGNSVEFNSPLLPGGFKAEYIIWDFQLAYYDAGEIKNHLAKSRLSFCSEKENDNEIRIISDGKKRIEIITIKKDFILIKNYLRGYEYELFIGADDE